MLPLGKELIKQVAKLLPEIQAKNLQNSQKFPPSHSRAATSGILSKETKSSDSVSGTSSSSSSANSTSQNIGTTAGNSSGGVGGGGGGGGGSSKKKGRKNRK